MKLSAVLKSWIRFRILPLTMFTAAIMLAVTVQNMFETKERLDEYLVSAAIAEDEKEDTEAPDTESDKDETTEDSKPDEDSDSEEASEEEEGDAKEGEVKEDKEDNKDEKAKSENPNVSTEAPEDILKKREFSQVELDLLQSLSQRREQIEAYAKEVDMRASVLEATEKRIDDKISKMNQLQKEVQRILEEYKKQDETELRSLVKIYENMKPKDAARIFDEMDMDIMLQVVDRMSERKAAPVLAAMNPTRAKDLTIELAEMRRLRRAKTEGLLDESGQPVDNKQEPSNAASAQPPSEPASNSQ
jgi:flagellar motility protein MotE (MotC chaperone)